MIYLDTETRGVIDLIKSGSYRYAGHSKSEVILIGWMDDSMDHAIWIGKDDLVRPDLELRKRIAQGETIVIHNYQFEALLYLYHLQRRLAWPENPNFLYDTAAMARAMALPAQLDALVKCIQMCLHQPIDAKDSTGRQIMLKFCRPSKDGRWYWHDEQYQRLGDYCCKDVEITRKAFYALRMLDANEYHHFMLTEKINSRGVKLDKQFAEQLVCMADEEMQDINAQICGYTNGEVTTVNKVADLKRWLSKVTGLQFVTVGAYVLRETLLLEDLGPLARKVIELRLLGAKTSIAKIKTMLAAMDPEDHCIRGMFVFCGAGKTGRWSSRLVQLHNMPRAGYGEATEAVIKAIKTGGAPAIRLLFPNVMDELPKLIRNLLIAREGHKFVCGDFAGVEARILVWLAGDDRKLQLYRDGEDVYSATAASIGYKERQIGKTCIAYGELVLTDQGPIPIQLVTTRHQLWDGLTWVRHEGVVSKGVRKVMTYDGLTATPDHEVYTHQGKTTLAQAALRKRPLIQTGSGRRAIWVGDRFVAPDRDSEQQDQGMDTVYQLRKGEVDRPVCITDGQEPGLYEVFPSGSHVHDKATQEAFRRQTQVYRPKLQRLQELWRTGYWVLLGKYRRRYDLYRIKRKLQRGYADRSNRQRWGLRTGKHQVCQPTRTAAEQTHQSHCDDKGITSATDHSGYTISILLPGGFVCTPDDQETTQRLHDRRDHRPLPQKQTKVPQADEVPVYDIINAGTRHRFTVSDVLVSNCELALGYSGGVDALESMANRFGIELDAKEAVDLVKRWRGENPATVALWRSTWVAVCQAMTHPNQTFHVLEKLDLSYKFDGVHLWCRLPSGRLICNPFAESIYVEGPQGTELQIKAVSASRLPAKDATQWPKIALWPGILVENICQAIGADLLRWSIDALEKQGKNVVLHVHDEFVCEVPTDISIAEVSHALTILPDWARGLPFDVGYWEGPRYRK